MRSTPARALLVALVGALPAFAQTGTTPPAVPPPTSGSQSVNYVVGPQDVLVITSYDQPELTGKFTVETDGTFTYPLVGRVRAGGRTLREIESDIRKLLVDQGFFLNPSLAVSIETYRSQRIYVVGEVRAPGAYPLSGDMRLVEALALAGSTLATASGEAVIVRQTSDAVVVAPAAVPARTAHDAPDDPEAVVRVDLRELENGDLTQNVPLRNGDTIFVVRAENVYVFGQVRNPGAYPLRQKNTTVLQALSLAGGVTDRASTNRVQIVRIVDGKKIEIRADLTDFILPRDTIIVRERFF